MRCSQSAWMNNAVTRRAARNSASCDNQDTWESSSVDGTVPQRVNNVARSAGSAVSIQRNTATHAATISRVPHGGPDLRRLGSVTNTARRSGQRPARGNRNCWPLNSSTTPSWRIETTLTPLSSASPSMWRWPSRMTKRCFGSAE